MTEESKEQKKVLQLYSAFGASLVLMLVPSAIVALVASILFLGVLIAAYIMRKGAEPSSLQENHMIYIIRTIWIGGLFSILTMVVASAYMLSRIDNTPLEPCSQSLMSNAAKLAENEDMMGLMNVIKPCMDGFISINAQVFMIAMAISALPILLYFIIRFSRGLSRALSGYRVANPKNWF
ncbi:MAG: hypothetical protein DHS20C02_18350 [Micavibrio sp.]|nr:MAG: hypothetical protein DHS20C02_18350 [Micavibrio sp.]